MFDTMTLTKTLGGLCGALLIFLLGGWLAESLYSTGGGHGDDHAQAYVIDTGEGEGHSEEVVEVSFADVFAAADIEKGAKVFGKCKACHKLEEGANSTGPYLLGVVDRPIGSVADFGYSGALNAAGDAWTPEVLNEFLTSPKSVTPGTTMSFAGLKKIEDRANVIAYLQSLN